MIEKCNKKGEDGNDYVGVADFSEKNTMHAWGHICDEQ